MSKDQAFDANLHQDPQKSIRKGFIWIGIASTLSQILSAVTMFVVMLFLTKDEMGTATIAIAFGVIFEGFNSLGTNQALLQDKNLTRDETHSVFWFAAIFGVCAYIIVSPLAWVTASFYNLPALIPMILVMMLKTPIVSIAAIPLQLINRRFEYEKISAQQAITTIFCSVLKMALAAAGLGAWSLVIGESAFALGTLFFAFYFSKYRPVLHFKWHECTRFISFGIKAAISNTLDLFTKNLHYLIVGKFLGEGILGIYRIAYELAMTPALALFSVVTKSSFPVFSRLQDKRTELSSLFAWNQRNLALFAAVPTVFILFTAVDIFNLIPNEDWHAATAIVPFVLLISFCKSMLQTYPDLYRACGKPSWPIYFQVAEAALFFILGSATLYFFPADWGLQAMLCVWFVILAGLVLPHRKMVSHFIDISLRSMAKSLVHGLAFFAVGSLLSILPWYYRDLLPWTDISHIAVEVIILLAVLWAYGKFVLHVRVRDLLKKR